MAEPGPLIVIGGHEDKDHGRVILREVARRLDGGRLVIATVASHQPDGYFDSYRKAFEPLGVTDLVEQMHRSVGKRAALLGAVVTGRTRGVTGWVYGAVRGTTRLVPPARRTSDLPGT